MSWPVMLMAAGFGTRMGALTANRPKPLIPVGGKALIDHARSQIAGIEADPVIANAHYRADQIAAHLAGTHVTVVTESPELLDTGGGLRNALPHLVGDNTNKPVITLNTDAVWDQTNPLHVLTQSWVPGQMDALLLCVPVERAIGRLGGGDFDIDADGRIQRGGDVVFCGAQILNPSTLAEVPDRIFSTNRVWDKLMARGTAFAVTYPGHWCDVGHPDGLKLAEDFLASSHV